MSHSALVEGLEGAARLPRDKRPPLPPFSRIRGVQCEHCVGGARCNERPIGLLEPRVCRAMPVKPELFRLPTSPSSPPPAPAQPPPTPPPGSPVPFAPLSSLPQMATLPPPLQPSKRFTPVRPPTPAPAVLNHDFSSRVQSYLADVDTDIVPASRLEPRPEQNAAGWVLEFTSMDDGIDAQRSAVTGNSAAGGITANAADTIFASPLTIIAALAIAVSAGAIVCYVRRGWSGAQPTETQHVREHKRSAVRRPARRGRTLVSTDEYL